MPRRILAEKASLKIKLGQLEDAQRLMSAMDNLSSKKKRPPNLYQKRRKQLQDQLTQAAPPAPAS